MNKSKVSVILPFYGKDTPAGLHRALLSVQEQSHQNLEIVLVQDGPVPHELLGTAARMMAGDKRIVLMRNQKNMGLRFTLNRAIMSSSGHIIARQDADDISHKNRIEKQLGILTAKGLDLLGSWFYETAPDGEVSCIRKMPVDENSIRQIMPITSPFCHGSVMFRKEPLIKLGLYSDDPPNEDYGLWQKALKAGLKMGNIPEPLYYFKVDPDIYYSRRRGIKVAVSETKIRFRVIREGGYPSHLYIIAGVIFFLRLMPLAVIRGLYKVRDLLSERETND